MNRGSIFDYCVGSSPIMATAIHDGHEIRNEVARQFAIDEFTRLREEDPFTGQWTNIVDNRVIVRRSRFEMDLNRVREKAVYVELEDAWGLKVWSTIPSLEMINRSLVQYDSFYSEIHEIFTDLQRRFGKFVILDLHAYNHRRDGRDAQPADAVLNPEVNIGTRTMDRERWEQIINRFIKDLSSYDYLGRKLDVRENIKFFGGQLAKWTHKQFSESACVLSIEFKKFFMDEWSGKPDDKQVQAISDALKSTIPGLLEELAKK